MNLLIVEAAVKKGWLNPEQVKASRNSYTQNPSLSISEFWIQQGWLTSQQVNELQAMIAASNNETVMTNTTRENFQLPETMPSQAISVAQPTMHVKVDPQSVDLKIDPGRLTIPNYMAKRGIEGGVHLEHGAHSPSEFVTDKASQAYEVGEMVAHGGMGVVFFAKDSNLRRTVAMKVILPGKDESVDQILRFIEEAQVTGQLEHPNIVPVHELGVDAENHIFYTMKYVKGITLKTVLENIKKGDSQTIARFPLTYLLTIFQKVCDAIAFSHSRKVIHRDLKPENIMIGDYGEVLVMDWGLAKILGRNKGSQTTQRTAVASVRLDQNESQTLDGQIMGTPGFMAPEQADGRLDDIDARTDIYMLGGILYNILTLNQPITGENITVMLNKILKGDITSPSNYNVNTTQKSKIKDYHKNYTTFSNTLHHCPDRMIPESLSAVTMKALSLRREARYQTVKELQKDIESYQGGFATSAEEAGMFKQLVLLVKRHKREASLLGASLAILLIVISIFIFKLNIEKNRALAEKNRATENEKIAKANESRAIESERVAREEKARTLTANEERAIAMEKLAKANEERALAAESLAQASAERAAANEERARASEEREKALQKLAVTEQRAAVSEKLAKASEERATTIEKTAVANLGIVQATAPAFYEQANALVEAQKFEEALEKIAYATKLAPNHAEYHYLKGNILESLLRFKEASNEYTQALQWNPKHELASQNQFLCNLILKENEGSSEIQLSSLEELQLAMQKQGRVAEAVAMLKYFEQNKKLTLNTWLNILGKSGLLEQLKAKNRKLHQDKNGNFQLDLSDIPIADLKPLKGMPLSRLNLARTQVTDLSPLKGMPLTTLGLYSTTVTDLSPLKGLPLISLDLGATPIQNLTQLTGIMLNWLDLSATSVTDLSPLKGMPLTTLILSNTQITDLSPLKGMALTSLSLSATPIIDLTQLKGMPLNALDASLTLITDLTPLNEMPLKILAINGCQRLGNLTPLIHCKTLEKLSIPNQIKDLDFLRKMPNLKFIDYRLNDRMKTTNEFWKK